MLQLLKREIQRQYYISISYVIYRISSSTNNTTYDNMYICNNREDVMLDDRHCSRKFEPNSNINITRRFVVQMLTRIWLSNGWKLIDGVNLNNTKKVFIKVILSLYKGYHESWILWGRIRDYIMQTNQLRINWFKVVRHQSLVALKWCIMCENWHVIHSLPHVLKPEMWICYVRKASN